MLLLPEGLLTKGRRMTVTVECKIGGTDFEKTWHFTTRKVSLLVGLRILRLEAVPSFEAWNSQFFRMNLQPRIHESSDLDSLDAHKYLIVKRSEDGMPDRPNDSQEEKQQRIMVHAMEALEGVLAQSGAYPEMPDRNFFLMLVSSTLIKATHHLNEGESGPEKAARWVKQHLETLGPLLSKGNPRQIDVQVTIR